MLTMPVATAMWSVAASSPSTSVRSAGGEPPTHSAPNPSASTSRASAGVNPAWRRQKPYLPSSTVMIPATTRPTPGIPADHRRIIGGSCPARQDGGHERGTERRQGNKDELAELREKAQEHIADLPAETALGNADPEAPHTETPQEWEAEHPGPAS